jgi:hypothetical protein
MRKQLDYTRQHVERNEALVKLNSDQHTLILQLRDERQAAAVEHSRVLTELNTHEQRVHALGLDYAFRYQKVLLCMLAMRDTIVALVDGDTREHGLVRSEFARNYEAQMRTAISQGTIQRPVDQDDVFSKALPETHRFLIRMLRHSDSFNPPA